jgi:hypothetical protein
MKSKRAKEFIRNSAFSAIQLPGEVMYSIHMNVEGKLLDRKSAERAVELAEQDAEEKIEALKARAAEAFKEYMEQAHGGYLTSDLDNFIRKLNEQ